MTSKYIAIDIETTGLNWAKCGIVGIGYYSKEDKLIGFNKEVPNISPYKTIFHNGSFDVKVARKAGINLPYDHDTIIMASLLQFIDSLKASYRNEYDEDRALEDSLALDQLAIRDLGIKGDWKIDWDKEKPSYDRIKEHCLMDCRVTYHLFELYREKLQLHGLWDYYNNLLMPMARLLVDVECTGIRLDVNKLTTMKADYGIKLENWLQEFHTNNREALDFVVRQLKKDKIAKCKPGKNPKTLENRQQKIKDSVMSFNPKSHVHMKKLLELKGISLVDKKGKATTASKLLWKYTDDPIIGQIVEYKKLGKIYKDFLCKWDDLRINDILHTSFRLWATRTGRLSSAEPNLQQVPKGSDIRSLFIPREGYVFTVADAKQLEVRLAAFFSKEKALLKAFDEGIDVYGQIAIDLMGLGCKPNAVKEKYPKERQIGKTLFLASIYGQGSNSLHYQITKEFQVSISLEEVKRYKRLFNSSYEALSAFAEKCREEAERKGYITTWFGRKIFIPKEQSYKAINSYVQGSGSDMVGFSQMSIKPKLPKDAKLILLVHDEVVYEHRPEDTQQIVDLINKYMVQSPREKYGIPLDMEIKSGNSWGIK